MEIRQAQQEIRTEFLGGAVGQLVSGLIWLLSAALGTWVSVNAGVLSLTLGGFLIFVLTQLALKIFFGRGKLRKDNPFNYLAMQVAFVAPLCLPVILPLARFDPNWFYPAFMIVVGAHYLPFITLYGMWQFGVLASALLGAGLLVRYLAPDSFALGAWLAAVILFLYALWIAWMIAARKLDLDKLV